MGGYQLIDLKGTATTGTLSGLHAKLASAYKRKKAVLVYGLNVSGTIQPAGYGYLTTSSTSYVINVSGHTVTVTTSDVLTIS